MNKTTTKQNGARAGRGAKAKNGTVGNRIASTLKNARTLATNVRNKTVAGAKATDRVVRANPYKAIAVAVGAGLLAGAIVGRRSRKAAPAAEAAD